MIFNIPLARNLGLVLNAQHPYSLHIGGVDVILATLDPIHITEAGSGGVSSMSFAFDDPDSSFAIEDGAEVRMWDYVRDVPLFLGFVESVSYALWATGGRTIEVAAFGIEALLDDIVIPSLTISNQMAAAASSGLYDFPFALADCVQLICGFGPLRQFLDPALGGLSDQAHPVAIDNGASWLVDPAAVTVTTPLDGTTLRGAYEAMFAVMPTDQGDGLPSAQPYYLGVDFYGGVRFFAWGGATGSWFTPSDWVALTISDTAGGAVAAKDLTYQVDTSPSAITNAVYVKGATAAATGWVVGDTRTGRREAYTTTNGTTTEQKLIAGWGVINQRAASAGRGSFALDNFTPTNCHPGGSLVMTDARMGWSSKQFSITQIDKTIVKGSLVQDWVVSFTDPVVSPAAGPASAARLLRTFTRAVLN